MTTSGALLPKTLAKCRSMSSLIDPGREFADLYRLVDVRSARDVRVSMPARPGFLKAVRLAASLGLPVRLLPQSADRRCPG